MNWEVPTLKSRTSCFEPAIMKSLLRRFWPLWLIYTLVLLLIPLSLYSGLKNYRPGIDVTPGLNFQLANWGEALLFVSFAAGVIAAMVAFGFLYSSRSCGLMTSLPVTRSCLFLTCFVSGLFPLLFSDLFAALVTALFCLGGNLDPITLVAVFSVLILSTVFFYGFASFCAMLTGNILILPAVYIVLNFTAVLVEEAVRDILKHVLYGLSSKGGQLSFLSPLVQMIHKYAVQYQSWPDSARVKGVSTVGLYAFVGLLFTLLAWRIFLRRRMETAGDTISIPVLRPIFVGCMTGGTAIMFAEVLYSLLDVRLQGTRATLVILSMLLFGAFLGYFAGRMVVERSFHVFRGHWKGYILSACVILLIVGVCEFDLFGYERRVPGMDEIESVSFGRIDGLREPDTIEDVLNLHKSLIDHKDRHESYVRTDGEYVASGSGETQMASNLTLFYHLKNGKTLMRSYKVFADNSEMEDPASDICQMEAIYNLPESLRRQCETSYPMLAENVMGATLRVEYPGSLNEIEQENVTLSPEELLDLWTNGVLPDMEEGHFARTKLIPGERDWQKTNVELTFILVRDRAEFDRTGGSSEAMEWHSYTIEMDSVHTLEWIRLHTRLVPSAEISY